ncbi:MAG: hypothetical protein Pg6A_02700 [Termitinemataceae bacterium]|jgi:4-hydroxy-3-methylbut-2-enyl diphosphate reductase|nr:MAG: hypothetical protein Pg6A_02700 [Termitinemataceae bacterium]
MICVSKVSGMCSGAKGAYKTVLKLLESKKYKRVILYKKLLHNRDVIKDLELRGAVFCESLPDEITDEDIIVIRAHGETESFFKELEARKINYADCTCPRVKRIHSLISQKHNAGYAIVIIGNKDHAEVSGSAGWCAGNSYIVSSVKDIKQINGKTKNLFVIAQTTFNNGLFFKIESALKKLNNKTEVYNSLCDAQRRIHEESALLAKNSDVMFVLGSAGSANTKELYKQCAAFCKNTFLIEGRGSFFKCLPASGSTPRKRAQKAGCIADCLAADAKIGITGGASTPPEVISEFKSLLEWNQFYSSVYEKIKNHIAGFMPFDDNPVINAALLQFSKIAKSKKAKFLRGTLIALGFRIALSNKKKRRAAEDEWLPLACAYELLETAILVHDDVFDKAALRRGEITIHKSLELKYGSASKSAAICAGDIGFYTANKIILENYKNHKNCFKVLLYLQEIIITTIKGELLDILLPLDVQKNIFDSKQIAGSALLINQLKTACYTAAGPLCLGMMLGGAEDAALENMRAAALELGVAFQLLDDIMDIFGGKTGKPQGADIGEHKVTTLYACACAKEEYKNQLQNYYGKKANKNRLEAVRQIFKQSGAYSETRLELKRRLERCRTLLRKNSAIAAPELELLMGFSMFIETQA